jgi:hypothetical protein
VRWLILVALTTAAAPAAEKVEILRDEYGVPHIFAATAQGAAYASGRLQASDRAEQLLRHLSSAKPTAVSPELRPIIDAFCAGLHAAGAQEVEPEMVAGYAATLALGGSTIVIPADRTASQAPIAIIDPLENYDDTPYQMVIGGGYNWVGAVPVGLPFPLTGHGYDSVVGPADLVPGNHILDQAWRMQAGPHSPAPSPSLPSQTTQMTRALLGFNAGTTIYDALRIATSSEVYRAGVWQKRIASVDADSAFARVLTGWSRRAEFNSAPALAFYLFKMALGTDAMAIEPPDSLSDNRVRAALRTAQDQLETKYPFQAAFGTLFQVAGKPASGGTLTEAGMATPRAVTYEKRGSVMTGTRGQTATQVVEMARPVPKSYMLIPLEGSPAQFARGEMQPTYFGDRKELEKHVRSRAVVIAP